MEDRGLEPGAFLCGDRLVLGQGGSESGSVVATDVILADELAWVMSAWGGRPPDTRTAILAIVEAAQGASRAPSQVSAIEGRRSRG